MTGPPICGKNKRRRGGAGRGEAGMAGIDIAAWLRDLGPEQYRETFEQNDIGGEVLQNLTADDLKELGIASVGHRRTLLDAIARHRASPLESRSEPDHRGDLIAATDAKAPAPAAVPVGLRALGGTIAWLFGATAGVGTVLYAFGYLITQANLQMLGVELLDLRYDPALYARRGFEFLQLSAMLVGQVQFWLLLGLALGFLSWHLIEKASRRLATKQPFRCIGGRREVWRAIAYMVLLLLLARQLKAHLWFPEDLMVAGVLTDSAAAISSIRAWILSGKEDLLLERYAILVNQQVVIGLLLLAWALNRAWRWNALLVAPFAVVFAISLAWLPQEYGKLALSNKFLQALIRYEHPAEPTSQPALTLYLVNKTDSEFVLWDAHQRKIVWVPSRIVASAEISESRTLSQIIRSSEKASQ
jgi:SAM domain (Sterile alpha motif)